MAGNLTQDRQGYQYYYDYENRIIKITKNGQTKAEFTYDDLGKRIRKIDSVVNKMNTYYYNDNWQRRWLWGCPHYCAIDCEKLSSLATEGTES